MRREVGPDGPSRHRRWTRPDEGATMNRVGADPGLRPTDTSASLRVFGGVALHTPGGPIGFGGARQQRLLALFVIRHGQMVTVEWLAEYLWSDDERPSAYATRLRTYVSRLRQSLPEDARGWIETEHGGYRLVTPPDALEHVRFSRLRRCARDARDAGDPLTARRLLDEALALWRGEPFRELEDLEWARADIERLHLDRLEMLEERWETDLELGRHTQITGELGAFVREQPLRERPTCQYALALHRSGRTSEALRVLTAFRRALADQTGLEPSGSFDELESSLLHGDPALDAPAGRPLRGYRLVEQVGAGSFAVVWRATQPSVDRDVAIKQIRPELATRPEFIRRFEAEARLVARIEHPHVVPLIDYWREPDAAYLVMRWLGGDTLTHRLEEGALPVDEVLALAEEIGGALSAAHANGVVHRDVKPSNILFDGAGHAYLTDFGIAFGESEPAESGAVLSPGSPAYASPEQLRGEEVDSRADVFGLGVVIHECLTGSPPDGTEHHLLPDTSGLAAVLARATAPRPADRFTRVDELLEALRSAVGIPRPVAGMAPVGPTENPYVGLRAFDDGDAHRFFGRDRLIDEIVARLSGTGVSARCVVVVGPSGSGKSSVVRAGVVPALRCGAVPGSDAWFTTTMVPGGDVYESLEAALLRIAVNPPASLLGQLRNGERGILRCVRRCVATEHDCVTLVIDQFEELFTGSNADTAEQFLDALAVAVEAPSSPLRLIATIRADYYDRPLQHVSFAPIVKEAAVEVTPLTTDELVEAITEPARRVGVEFQTGLVARMTAGTIGQPSPLPLLQYALSELFDRRGSGALLTVDDYDAVGGIAGALATRAETLYADSDTAERAAIRSLFGRLTVPHETSADLRRRVPISDLGDDEPTHSALERFGTARLLTFDRDPTSRAPTVEVAHEALLRAWPRAADWLRSDRDLRRTVDSIGAAATTWELGGRQSGDLLRDRRLDAALEVVEASPDWLRSLDREFVIASRDRADVDRRIEQQRIRRLRRLVVATAATLVVALVAGVIAVVQQRRADDEARAAEDAAVEAERQRRVAEDQAEAADAALAEAQLAALVATSTAISADRPDVGLLLALEARRRSPGAATDRALLDALAVGRLGRQVAAMERLPAVDCRGFTLVPNDVVGLSSRRISPDGLREFGTIGDQLVAKDLVSGVTTTHGTAPEPCISWFPGDETGLRLAESLTVFTRRWTARAGDGWSRFDVGAVEELLRGPIWPGNFGAFLHPELVDGRLLVAYFIGPGSEAAVAVVDPQRPEPLGPADPFVLDIDGPIPATAASDVAGLFAVGAEPAGGGGISSQGMVLGLDAATGSEVLRLALPSRVTAVAFGPDGGRLIVGGENGVVTVADVATGEVIHELAATEPLAIVAVGARPGGGGVVAVSSRWIELFDSEGVRAGPPIAIPDNVEARVRPDGTVVVVPTADTDTIRIIDPKGGPLVEQGFTVEPDELVVFGAGQAGVIDRSGSAEIVELATGSRSDVVTDLPGAPSFDAVAIAPAADGFLAWDSGTAIARWRDGRVVEQLELWSGTGTVTLSRDGGVPSSIGDGYVGAGAAVVFQNQIPIAVFRFDAEPGRLALLSTIPSPPRAAVAAVPATGGGVHLVLDTGWLRTYGSDGSWTDELATGLRTPRFAVTDPATGTVAIGGDDGAVIVDPSAAIVQPVADVGGVVGLEFARGGALLVIVEDDGTVRVWDTGRAERIGTVWTGDGTTSPSRPWYDESTDTVWVATSGAILQLALDPERWVDRICDLVSRELTVDEWSRLVPGDSPPRPACA
jgi:DNA-binding SARP family transcriptional activator